MIKREVCPFSPLASANMMAGQSLPTTVSAWRIRKHPTRYLIHLPPFGLC